MDPFGYATYLPSGDKTFSRFQKCGLPPLKRNVNTPFLTHKKKYGDAPGPPGDLVKSLLGLFGFSHLRLLHRICKTRHFKISKNYRFFNQKKHLPAQNLSFA